MAALKEYMAAKYHQLLSVNNITQLARLLKIGEVELYRLRFEKPYSVFEVKKQNGKFRLIEAPQKDLKKILQELNSYLQCAYFFNRTPSAYGFILQPRNTTKKKSILSNAYRHCGKKFMLNIDLEDFFHQVSKFRIIKIFTIAPFNFPMELSTFLGELVTYKNRLPMGSPTSPSLSNFSTIGLDKDLEDFCKEQKITYTRYVDDLTFSSSQPIDSAVFYNIQQVLAKHTFRMNVDKIRWMGENDTKETTGLILKERPEVTVSFL
jgi:RNA-directed DNA polymerase